MSRACLAAGDWDELLDQTDQDLRLSTAHSYRLLATDYHDQRALVAAARGEDETTTALTDETTRWAAPRHIGFDLASASQARALAALYWVLVSLIRLIRHLLDHRIRCPLGTPG
ncbi:hypothetical protein ACFWX8_44495, partial [Streptomyces violascens]